MDEKTDEDLVREMQGEQERPFKALYERHSQPLFRFIYRFTANAQAAEEILHDVFMQVVMGRFTVNENSTFKSWLYTVAKNRSLNYLKADGRVLHPLEIQETPDFSPDAESQMLAKDRTTQLAKAVLQMPEDLKATWSLRKQGLDNKSIAESLSIPLGTVKSRFHRLVEYLRKEMESET